MHSRVFRVIAVGFAIFTARSVAAAPLPDVYSDATGRVSAAVYEQTGPRSWMVDLSDASSSTRVAGAVHYRITIADALTTGRSVDYAAGACRLHIDVGSSADFDVVQSGSCLGRSGGTEQHPTYRAVDLGAHYTLRSLAGTYVGTLNAADRVVTIAEAGANRLNLSTEYRGERYSGELTDGGGTLRANSGSTIWIQVSLYAGNLLHADVYSIACDDFSGCSADAPLSAPTGYYLRN
jgi:hypothetical protein